MKKMGLPLRKDDRHYTYRDYRQWPEDERWELIRGVAYSMDAPTLNHQGVIVDLLARLAVFLKDKPCRVFPAPVDVLFPQLNEQDEDNVDTVVQPDIVVVCDPDQLKLKGVWGAPTFVVEILSPSTTRKDLREKFDLYQRSGVKEYWVIDPVGRWLQQYSMGTKGTYDPETALAEFTLDTAELWAALPVKE